jgi:predicted GIY-YIG superfamily endonuclease
MAVEPKYPREMGPEAIRPDVLRMVSNHIKRAYWGTDESPEHSEKQEDFWILGMADDDIPPIYKFPKPYAVYSIRCERPRGDVVNERQEQFDVRFTSEFFKAYMLSNGPVTYVGYTKNPYRRMNEHFDPFTSGAEFTDLFPPYKLLNIEWCGSEDMAREREQEIAKDWKNGQGNFVNPSPLKCG